MKRRTWLKNDSLENKGVCKYVSHIFWLCVCVIYLDIYTLKASIVLVLKNK